MTTAYSTTVHCLLRLTNRTAIKTIPIYVSFRTQKQVLRIRRTKNQVRRVITLRFWKDQFWSLSTVDEILCFTNSKMVAKDHYEDRVHPVMINFVAIGGSDVHRRVRYGDLVQLQLTHFSSDYVCGTQIRTLISTLPNIDDTQGRFLRTTAATYSPALLQKW